MGRGKGSLEPPYAEREGFFGTTLWGEGRVLWNHLMGRGKGS